MRIARAVVGLALLAVLFHFVPLRGIVAAVGKARVDFLLVAVVIPFLGIVVSSLKLWLLLRADAPGVGFGQVLKAYYIGTFFNNLLPTSIGGDVAKVRQLRLDGTRLAHAAASVIVERATGLAVVLAATLGISLGWSRFLDRLGLGPARWALAAVSGGCFIALAIAYAAWRGAVKDWMKARRDGAVVGKAYMLIESFYVFRNAPGVVAAALGLSVLFYLIIAVGMVLVARALGLRLGPGSAAGLATLLRVPEMLPVSLGGLGVREGTLTYCMSHLGATAAQGAGMALVMRGLSSLHSAAGGLVYAVSGRVRRAHAVPPAPAEPTARRRALRVALIALIVLVLFTDGQVDGQNELSRMAAVDSLASRGVWHLNESRYAQTIVEREGRQSRYLIDMVYNRRDGRFYSSKPPVLTLLLAAVPAGLHALGARFTFTEPSNGLAVFLLTFLAMGLPSAWAFYALRRKAGGLLESPAGADVAALLAFGGTLFFTYSTAINHHTPTAAAILAAFFLLGMAEGRPVVPAGRASAAGFLMGLAAVIDVGHGFIFSVMFGLYILFCLRSWRTAVFYGLGALPPLALHCAIQYSLWGSILPVQMLHGTKDYPFSYWTHRTESDAWHIPRSDYWLLTLFSMRGLFVLSPILLFGAAGLAAELRDAARASRRGKTGGRLARPSGEALRGYAALSVLIGMLFLVWYSGFRTPTNFAGAAFGFRYYIGFTPLLAWYAVRAYGRWADSPRFRVIFYALGAWSLFYACLGTRFTWVLMEAVPHPAVRMLLPLRGF
ncbi:MAG: flippase-like domain-containing protein [Candidatus Brocadiaceae bacterium]|nr:flippase-like domain-containing protein [Candidatus Brocadiaceae bacterium]